MKTRKLVLIIADVVLLAVCIIQGIVSSIDTTKSFVFKDTPDEIHIYSNNKTIDIISSDKGETWYLGEDKKPANNRFVENLIDQIASIQAINKVGNVKNEADIERFELNEENCISVVAKKEGKLIRSVQIGKKASGASQVFGTVDGEKDIYLLKGDLRTSFDYEEDYLRNKIIYDIPAEQIKSISFTDDTGKEYKVTQEKDIQSFNTFCTETFILPEDLSSAVKRYSLKIEADKTVTMDIYELTEEKNVIQNGQELDYEPVYIGTSSESPYKFSVPAYLINCYEIVKKQSSQE